MEYYLFSATRQDKWTPPSASVKDPEPSSGKKKKGQSSAGNYNLEKEIQWSCKIPVAVRAMVKAGDTLFMAGPPDVLDEDVMFQEIHLPGSDPIIEEQNASYLGELGSIIYAVDAKTGKMLVSMEIDEVPAFDGLITANGKIYMSTTEGELVCFTPEK
jgi:outer membrane protein assembly factor BamB